MNQKTEQGPSKGWHLYNWTLLGWIETLLKSVAILIGIRAFYLSADTPIVILPSGVRLVALFILALLSLALFAAIFNRWQNKEIISMIFILFNNLGHWGMFVSLLRGVSRYSLSYFSLFMLLGDLTKILFLKKEHYSEKNISPHFFVYGTFIFVIGYSLIFVLSLYL